MTSAPLRDREQPGGSRGSLSSNAVEESMLAALREDIECVIEGDALRLDTPYVLQDGHLLRAYLRREPDGRITVSDDGFAVGQIELLVHSRTALRDRYAEMRRIARALDLRWDGEYSFTAPDLASAARRIPELARAVDRTLTLLHARRARPKARLKERLERELKHANLTVIPRARLELGPERTPVIVDYRVRRNGSEAVLEVIGGRTSSAATVAMDRAAATFRVLDRFQYPGRLFAVYDEDSPAGDWRLQERFRSVGPERAVLLPSSEAVPAILSRLSD